MPNFNGTESAEDVLNIALKEFSERRIEQRRGSILYDGNIPFLRYELRKTPDAPECICFYRLDTMLLPFFKEAERIYDALPISWRKNASLREPLIRYLACFGMQAMLSRLTILQKELFVENLDEGILVTSTFLLHSAAAAQETSENKSSLARNANRQVKKWLDEVVGVSMKKKRDFLVKFANSQTLMNIPTKAGRPLGTTKSEEKRAKEKAEFESKIEETIRDLFAKTGTMPTKTAVARALGIGGVNVATGVDSSLMVFRAKLARLDVDYNLIANKVRRNK
jgi:hypothetical protein